MTDRPSSPFPAIPRQPWQERATTLRGHLVGALGEAAAMILWQQTITVRTAMLEQFRYMSSGQRTPPAVHIAVRNAMDAVEQSLQIVASLGLLDRAAIDEVREWATSAPRDQFEPSPAVVVPDEATVRSWIR